MSGAYWNDKSSSGSLVFYWVCDRCGQWKGILYEPCEFCGEGIKTIRLVVPEGCMYVWREKKLLDGVKVVVS